MGSFSQTRTQLAGGALMLSAVLLGRGCAAPDEEQPSESSGSALVTNVVPTSDFCNSGLKGGECVSAPPANSSALTHFSVDGDRGSLEYAHALTLPYADMQLKATANVFVQAVHGSSVFGRPADGLLYLYFDDIPFSAADVNPMSEWTLEVYVDSNRFAGTTMCFDAADRRYEFNFGAHSSTIFQPRGAPQSCDVINFGWRTTSDPRVQFAVKGCAPDKTSSKVIRCSAEARIPIRNLDMEVPPTNGLKLLTPGVGFGVTSRRGRGAMPEHIAAALATYPHGAHTDRTLFPTLLFGPPKGPHSFPLRIMSFNVRRFASPGLKGPFASVDSGDIGKFVAPLDVVALQEGWDDVQVKTILKYANLERAALGKPPFELHGPIDFNPSLSKAIEETVGTTVLCTKAAFEPGASKEGKCETSGSHGGLWVLTSLQLAMAGREVYDMCKGEDCFRAKGVQWVRLLLNPPDVENQICHGEVFDGVVTQSSCDPLGSGDHFIDIFNTHLQASNPEVCDALDALDIIDGLITGAAVSPSAALGLITLKDLVANDLNCNKSDSAVRAQQLSELNAFIDTVAAKDRPAVVLGDFNLNGKTFSGEYNTLLTNLQLTPYGSTGTPQADPTTPWPDDYDWDIDHADIVRSMPLNFDQAQPIGTFIKDEGGSFVQGAMFAGEWDADSRYDYILLRPPTSVVSETYYTKTDWVAAKDGNANVWESPWPGIPGNFGEPPKRLSDHKPVIASFRFTPLAVPGRYHPTWRHDLEQRLASANAAGEDDCWGCDEVDLYTEHTWEAMKNQSSVKGSSTGKTCGNNDAVSFPPDGCMSNWKHDDTHNTQGPAANYFSAELWDADSSSGDDLLQGPYGQWIYWDASLVTLVDHDTQKVVGNKTWPLNDNEPVPQCTKGTPVGSCFRTDVDELGPGFQF